MNIITRNLQNKENGDFSIIAMTEDGTANTVLEFSSSKKNNSTWYRHSHKVTAERLLDEMGLVGYSLIIKETEHGFNCIAAKNFNS